MSETIEAPQVDAPAEAPAPDPAEDLRAAIGAAWDEHSPEEAERDANGRFVARERAATDVADHETSEGETQAEDKPDEVQSEAPEEARPALPPELAPVKAVLDEYRHLYAAKGVPAEAAVKALFDAEVALRSNPEQAFPALAQAFGFDIMKWAAARMQPPTQNAPAQTAPADTAYQALLAKVQQLETYVTAQEHQTQQARAAQVERLVTEFASDPKHEHFPSVEPMMAALIEKGIAKDLEAAYAMACRAHPEVSKKIMQAEVAAKEKAAMEAQRKAAAQAKAKAGSVRGSPTIAGFAKPPDDLRGVLDAAWDGRLN